MTRGKLLVVIIGTCAVLGVMVFAYFTRPSMSAEGSNRFFAESLARGDWAALYRQSPRSIWLNTGVSEEQFVILMSEVADSKTLALLQVWEVEKKISPGAPEPLGHGFYRFRFPHAPTYRGTPVEFVTETSSTREGWQVPVGVILFALAESRARSSPERNKLICEALEKAGIEEFPLSTRQVVITKRMREFLGDPTVPYHSLFQSKTLSVVGR